MARIITFDDDFIGALTDAIDMLDTLGQIQSAVGGLSMQHRANKTFEARARLENGLRRIIHAAQQETKENRLIATAPKLLEACDRAHETLEHYDLMRKPYGVDWAPVNELQQEIIDILWAAISAARSQEAAQ